MAAIIGVAIWLTVNPDSYETEIVSNVSDTEIAPLGVCVDSSDTSGASSSASVSSSDASSSGSNTSNSDAQNSTGSKCSTSSVKALDLLEKLEIKGRAPKTGYARTEFYDDWPNVNGCSLRQLIIKREFGETAVLDDCTVISGSYVEPYTGEKKTFTERSQISKGVQIDHVVALSDAWQKGAQNLSAEKRTQLATDPLNLLAVDSSANQKKSDGDAATWLPSNKAFRCQYVARQVSVKYKYTLWLAQAEHDTIASILEQCPNEPVVGVDP